MKKQTERYNEYGTMNLRCEVEDISPFNVRFDLPQEIIKHLKTTSYESVQRSMS